MRVVQETENLVRLTRFGMINCFLVREADGFTLVDTGLLGSAGAILRAAVQLGAPTRRIVMTHSHIDHIGSLDSLMAALPSTELAIGQREARLLAKDLSLDAGEKGKALLGFTGARARRSRLLGKGERVGSLQAVAWSQVSLSRYFLSPLFFRGMQCSRRKAAQNCADSIRTSLP